MTSDLDIYRTASGLIHEHGEDAALEAAQRADTMLEKGSLDGQPREGEAVNAGRVAPGIACYMPSMNSASPIDQTVIPSIPNNDNRQVFLPWNTALLVVK